MPRRNGLYDRGTIVPTSAEVINQNRTSKQRLVPSPAQIVCVDALKPGSQNYVQMICRKTDTFWLRFADFGTAYPKKALPRLVTPRRCLSRSFAYATVRTPWNSGSRNSVCLLVRFWLMTSALVGTIVPRSYRPFLRGIDLRFR